VSEALQQVDSGFDKLRTAGRNLWLAGLGAVAEVEEGGRELFDRLVERGVPVEGKQKKLAETVAERANKAARSFGKLMEETLEYESRGMLKRLNLMTREDVKILSARLETLSRKVNEYAVRHDGATQDISEQPTKTTKTVHAATASRTKKGISHG
jgi:poly(hydroxyalkanoate) granule-associated protein